MTTECGYKVFATESDATKFLGQYAAVIETPAVVYASEQEAAEALVHLARENTATMGKFHPLKPAVIQKLEETRVEFCEALEPLLRQPKGQYQCEGKFAKCHVCESLVNLEVLESKGICPVCPARQYAPFTVLPDDLPHHLSDRAICKKRTLYTKDYEQVLKRAQSNALQAVDGYKKRRTELLSGGNETETKFIVAWNKFT